MLSELTSSYICTWEVAKHSRSSSWACLSPRAIFTLQSLPSKLPRASITRRTHANHEPIQLLNKKWATGAKTSDSPKKLGVLCQFFSTPVNSFMTGECVVLQTGDLFCTFFTPDVHGKLLPSYRKVHHCAAQFQTQYPPSEQTLHKVSSVRSRGRRGWGDGKFDTCSSRVRNLRRKGQKFKQLGGYWAFETICALEEENK